MLLGLRSLILVSPETSLWAQGTQCSRPTSPCLFSQGIAGQFFNLSTSAPSLEPAGICLLSSNPHMCTDVSLPSHCGVTWMALTASSVFQEPTTLASLTYSPHSSLSDFGKTQT